MITTNEIKNIQRKVIEIDSIKSEIIVEFNKLLVTERYIDFYYLYNGVRYPDSVHLTDDIERIIENSNIDSSGIIINSSTFLELIFLDKGINYELIEEHCYNDNALLFFLENKHLSTIVRKDERILNLLYSRFKRVFKLLKYLIKNGHIDILDTTDSFTKSVIAALGE
jgi:hypothetical protein